jgi:predicted alpha/beta hydrolase family esterase
VHQGRTIVLVHGIGGPRPPETWLDALGSSLARLGYPTLGGETDRVVVVDYVDALLNGSADDPPPPTWRVPDDVERLGEWGAYLARKEAMADAVSGARARGATLPLSAVSDSWVADRGADWLAPVRAYARSARTRNAVWESVLRQLPTRGSVIVVAHSLGAVVTLDLLTRLPEALHVDLLLTVGAPMGVRTLRKRHAELGTVAGFPASRIGCWVNVYDPDDLVTVGRGAARHFPAALDAPVHAGLLEHGIQAYMGQPVVAGAIGLAAFGPLRTADTDTDTDGTVARRIDPQWQPLLLRFAFTHELWNSWPTDEWNTRRRMDLARKVLAQRSVDESAARRERYLRQAQSSPGPIREAMLAGLADSPLGAGRSPTRDDLWRHPVDLVRDQYTDEQLALAGVDLLMAPPFDPFGIDVPASRMREALEFLLTRIRQDSSTMSGRHFADAIATSVKESRSALEDDAFPWTPVLVGTGILVLAATGIGLVIAAPAGLAGAALVTTTLATFGPGGMAGGVATLAVLTGTSMALTTAGIAREVQAGDQFADLQLSIAQELAGLPRPALRTALAGLLAVVGTRRRLALPSNAAEVEQTLLLVQATVLHEVSVHEAVSPGSRATKEWQRKAALVLRALDWLTRTAQDGGIPDRERRAAEAAMQGSASPADPARPAIEQH